MNPKNFVFLEVTTWAGISFGARHYYGELKRVEKDGNIKSVELAKPLSAREAAKMNKGDYWKFYKAGYMYNGFNTKKDICKLAVKVYKEHFDNAEVLILGSLAIADPQPVLDGPEDFKNAVNALVDELDRIGGYEGNYKRSDEIYRAYKRLLKEMENKDENS